MAIASRAAIHRMVAAASIIALPFIMNPAMAETPKSGGSLSISLEADLPTLDPIGFSSFNDRQAGVILYDTLLTIDTKGNVVPNIAEKIDSAPDATWFKLTLHKGVKFQDGTPLDADAVVKHFKRLSDPKHRCRCLSDLAAISTVEATGPLEITFKMKSPAAYFPALLADVPGMVASPTAVEKAGADYGATGIGAGPFKLKEWQRGNQVVFERNPDYWKGKPLLDEVVLRPMTEEQTRYASLKAGNLDIVMNAAPRDIVDARASKKFKVVNPGSLATSFVMLNLRKPDVSDIRVRQAMAYALDRNTINKAINKGVYKVANTPFGSGLSPHEAVDGYPGYDPAKAKKLLAEYGKPVKVQMSIRASGQNALMAQAIQQMWKKVGIETEILQMEQVQLVRAAFAKDYQVMLYRWAGGADPDKNVYSFFYSTGSANRVQYNNPDMDRLLDAARGTTDPAARLKDYREINNLLARDLPYLFLNYFDNISLTAPSVHGITAIPDGLLRLDTVWKDK
jgi:ABC-type transport system substrate-binding protein